jgi:uncharacterized protein YndB with AHSA1/START domain
MMKVLKFVVALVLLLVVAVVVVGLFLPKKYDVERSITIDAPPEVVFAYLNDLEKWEAWEPFSKSDASIVTTIGEPSAGVGATQSWTSDGGNGSLTFTMADPDQGIAYDLNFDGYDPAFSRMTYAVIDGKTVLTWSMEGEITTPVIGGYFVLLMDSMVGQMYDNGLANIKETAEADAAAGDQPEDADGDDADTPGGSADGA